MIVSAAEKGNTLSHLGLFSIAMTLEEEMLDELKRIREAVTPKPASPPAKGIWAEFVDFMARVVYSVWPLASSWASTWARWCRLLSLT
jgi:hypothetical protein